MLKKYYPGSYIDSVFDIDYKKLYSLGYRGILFDIDNTLVKHGADSNEEVDTFFKYIYELGFKTVLLSNNSKERIERFNKNIHSLYIEEANKPESDSYYKAIELLDMDKREVISIGDQIFTDIIGANQCDIDNILVKYVGYGTYKKIGIRRHIENMILFFYKHSSYYNHLLKEK